MTGRSEIVLIGPVYPYKGGIAHYTGLLCRALAKKYRVRMISYKMQYPKLLFKREQRDYSNDSFKIDGAEYLIHTANPFNWIKCALEIRKKRPAMILIQWWHPYFAPCYYVMSKIFRGINLVYLCHNVFPHERFPLDRFLTRMVLRQGKHFILHSETEAKELLSIKGDADYRVNVHPTYNAFKLRGIGREEARRELHRSEDEKLLLFFGFVRPYKGLKHLLHAVAGLRDRMPELKLMVVGDFGGGRAEYDEQIRQSRIEDRVLVRDGYTPDREVEAYFAACDLVVLPYESATQSGIVQIAYGFHRPVVATRVGGLPEVVADGRTGFLVPEKDPEALAEAILRFFEENRSPDFEDGIVAEEEKYSWDRMVEKVEDFL